MRTGDIVFNRPTGEEWVVAYVEDDGRYLAPCGWPFCLSRVEDNELRESASDEESRKLLGELADMAECRDLRRAYARRKLGLGP